MMTLVFRRLPLCGIWLSLFTLPLLIGGLLVAPRPVFAAEPLALPTTFNLTEIDEYVVEQVAAKDMAGLSLAILDRGQIVLSKGYGKASLREGTAVTAETAFAAGSITKQFACACLLLLAEEGKLSVHDKVAQYYPDLSSADRITLYDLMTHASGYPDYYPLDFLDRRMQQPIQEDDLLREYAGGKLDFEPGTRWSYSNTGYILLGRVIEKVTGKPFDEFLTERILRPVGMEHSVQGPPKDLTGIAEGHGSFMLGPLEPFPREAAGWIHAAGGLYTPAVDLAKWDLALLEGRVLKPESWQLMTTPRLLTDGRKRAYGCGLGIGEREGEMVYSHGGAVSGFLAINVMIPRTKSAVVLMTNSEQSAVFTLHSELLSLLLKSQQTVPPIPEITGLPAKEAAEEMLRQLQEGTVDRQQLGAEFSHYLNDARLQGARERLSAMGKPESVVVEGRSERGGMEVASVGFTFAGGVRAFASMYRTPDGKIQQFLLTRR